MRNLHILIFSLVTLLASCSTFDSLKYASFDSRKVAIQSLSLYHQRELTIDSIKFKGNWEIRRERLGIIDGTLRRIKPDLLLLQEVLTKGPTESDQLILRAGALMGYDLQAVDYKEYKDTHEIESLAVASSIPIYKDPYEDERKKMWVLGSQSYVGAFIISLEGQEIAVFNVKIAEKDANQGIWFSYLSDRIREYLEINQICPKRIAVAGLFENSINQKEYSLFLKHLKLVDSSLGFCEQESQCYTATSENPLYQLTRGDVRPSRVTRILVPESAIVYSGGRNFDHLDWSVSYEKPGKSREMAPTQFYGWVSSVRFARCSVSELKKLLPDSLEQ